MAREVWRLTYHKEVTVEIDTEETTIEQMAEDLLYDIEIEYDLIQRD